MKDMKTNTELSKADVEPCVEHDVREIGCEPLDASVPGHLLTTVIAGAKPSGPMPHVSSNKQ